MDARIGDMQLAQPVVHLLHEPFRATQVEIVVVERQHRLQQLGPQPTGHIVIQPLLRTLGIAEQANPVQSIARIMFKGCNFLIEGTLVFAARRLEHPHRTQVARAQAFAHDMPNHGKHGGDTHASRQEHSRPPHGGIDGEATRRRPRLN